MADEREENRDLVLAPSSTDFLAMFNIFYSVYIATTETPIWVLCIEHAEEKVAGEVELDEELPPGN